MFSWLKRVIAFALLIGPVIKGILWVIERAGDVEFVASNWEAIMGIIGAPWFALIAIPLGLLLIWWDIRKRQRPGQTQESLALPAATRNLTRIVIEGRRHDDLEIHKAYTPWRIWYPLHLVNASAVPVDIIGWNLNLLLNDSVIDRGTWRAPDGEASNGIPLRPNIENVEAYTIQPGQPYNLTVPINRRKIGDLPRENPKWGARGNVYLRCQGENRALPFNFDTDYYQLSQNDWVEWASQ